ncbi:hypothetical protein [Neolewinella agarilytica]|nr:hypothetical protein [Neolewinella agarilytica]
MSSDKRKGNAPIGWKAWWNGSVYANPLQESIGRLTAVFSHALRSPDEWVTGAQGSIVFSGGRVTVRDPYRRRQVYESYTWRDLEIHYRTPENAKPDSPYNSWITFNKFPRKVKIPFVFKEEEIRRLTSFFLRDKIPFKEYMNGKRAFRCRYLDAEQIDHVIKKYGIEW